MKLLLTASSIVEKDGSRQADKVYGNDDPIEITGFQLCVACYSIIVNGNYQKCLCGASLPYVEKEK